MMETRALIEKLLAADVLIKAMVEIPGRGATALELEQAAKKLGAPIDIGLVQLLSEYNGIGLDVIRFYAVDALEANDIGIKFADDPSGFVYYVTGDGKIKVEDTDGGRVEEIALSIQDFVHSYLFGTRSEQFMGKDWHAELVSAGIAT